MQWISQHKLIFGLLVLLIAAGVWYGLSSGTPQAPLLSNDISPSGSPTQDSVDQELVGTLLALRAVTLQGTIFNDPAFLSLQDFGTPIIAEPIGRSNPFAPLAQPAAQSASAQTGTRR